MKQPQVFKPPTLAVEDYLKRTANSQESVKLTTRDVLDRVGNIIVYRGQLWSARDAQGTGEPALLRLMNERVCLHVEPLSELDRGPRNITERRYVLFMRASLESQAALGADDDPPTSVWLPKPLQKMEEQRTQPPPVVTAEALARSTVSTPLPPVSAAPKETRGGLIEPSDRLSEVDTTTAKSTPRSATTLLPITLAASQVAQTSNADINSNPLQTTAPHKRAFKPAWAVAAVLMLGPAFATVVVISASPSASKQVNTPTTVTAQPSGASAGPVPLPSVTEGEPSKANDSVRADTAPRPPEKAWPAVVAHVRSIDSSTPLRGINLRRYVYSITGQFMRCYEWATVRAGRGALGNVSVTVRLNAEGLVDSSVATGAKIRGLNSCIADVAARLPALMSLPKAPNSLRWTVAFEEGDG